MQRKIQEKNVGFRTTDGAGVSLVRVLSRRTIATYDPILMLDSFDSTNPADYAAGFPLHPHRGIETISLISQGKMKHKDSIGNEDTITDGEVQWMTAGSGILHEEMLPASPRMLGVQLWLNLPQKDKMADPEYHSIKKEQIPEIAIQNGTLRLISGEYQGQKAFTSKYLPLDYYHILLEPQSQITLTMPTDKSVMVFTLLGKARVADEEVEEKTAVKLTAGTSLELASLDTAIEILFISSDKLEEPVSWGGPIVMNTDQELEFAFQELRAGTFLKKSTSYD